MNPVTETLTVNLPITAVRRLQRVAEIAHRPVDEVIAETLQSSLPPLLEDVPEAFRQDLAKLETLTTAELWQQLHAQMDPTVMARYDALLAANAADTITPQERKELQALREAGDLLMFRKAYAAVLLKWRGERVPTLAELETAPR
jgi:hypothetical protein